MLSIIIVHYKTRDFTIQCLKSIRDFCSRMDYEVILVDNDSQDGIGQIIAADFPLVRFIETGRNTGFSTANNLGIKNARGEYILFLNSDTKLIEPIFDQLIEYMNINPRVGAVGPRHLYEDGQFQVSFGKFPTLWSDILLKLVPCPSLPLTNNVDWLSGSCLLVRRQALEDSGLFDEAFFMYLEDVDLCTRIRHQGWGTDYFPIASIIHFHGRSAKNNGLVSRIAYRQSQLHFAGKYYGKIGEIAMRTFFFIKFMILGIGNVLKFYLLKFLQRNTEEAHLWMSLSYKVLSMVFFSRTLKPVEPILEARP